MTAAKLKVDTTAVAYSYIRFSTPEQRKGDSLRRQTDDAKAWSDRNGIRLDTSLTLHDLGKSAFKGNHRTNPDRNALAAFLKLVEDGKIARGSFLLVESLDRLTREHIRPALTLLLNLIEAGVRVVQLKPVEVVYDEDVEPMTLMMALMELSRGNSESKVKSQRVGAAWANRRTYVREKKIDVLHGNLPAWVEERDGKLYANPNKAMAIQRIYRLASEGLGAGRIVKKLIAENVPPFLETVKGKGVKGERPGVWSKPYVALLLADRRVVGELQPKSKRLNDGEPIPGYFPQIITEDEWQRARAGSKTRRRPGQRGCGIYDKPDFVNVFGGLVKDARDGSSYCSCLRYEGIKPGSRGRPHYVLRNQASVDGRAVCQSFPLDTLERAVLYALKEVDPSQIIDGGEQPDERLAIAAELERVVAQVNKIKDNLLSGGDVSALADVLRQLETKQRELIEQEQAARQCAAVPLVAAWTQTQILFDALDAAPDPQDARLRLGAALRRIIENIYLLVVPRGRDRLAALQIWFKRDGKLPAWRNYLIVHRPAMSNGKVTVPGRWSVNSNNEIDEQTTCGIVPHWDLRKEEDTFGEEFDEEGHFYVYSGWRDVERYLLNLERQHIDFWLQRFGKPI